MTEERNTIAGLRVLVVDDTATNRQLLHAFLTRLGCQVLLAEHGAAAIELFRRRAPDIVLMDVMMPEMDGHEATRRIKALCGDRWVPVVFLSALDREENLVAGLAAGGDEYLVKPVNFTVLKAKLYSLARTIDMQRRLEHARQRAEAIADNIADCVVTIDQDGIIQSVNAAVFHLFGYEPAELVGRNVSVLMPEPHRGAHDGYMQAYLHGGMPKIIGMPLRRVEGQHKDGTLLPIELTVTEMRFEGRRLFVGIMHDIRERLAAERVEREHAATLQRYHDDKQHEARLAGEIVQRMMLRPSLADPRLHHWLNPATDFSGDVIAAAHAADGRLCAMLADATGHGLAAAISVLPVMTAFYNLVENGFPLGFIAHELNRQLRAFMPAGRFVAASIVCYDARKQALQLWLGGMPEAWLIEPGGDLRRRLPSAHLPLGIVDFDEDMAGIEEIAGVAGCQVMLVSDGLLEATNLAGEPFGAERLRQALAGAPASERLGAVRAALTTHLDGAAPHDDTSLLLIDCHAEWPAVVA